MKRSYRTQEVIHLQSCGQTTVIGLSVYTTLPTKAAHLRQQLWLYPAKNRLYHQVRPYWKTTIKERFSNVDDEDANVSSVCVLSVVLPARICLGSNHHLSHGHDLEENILAHLFALMVPFYLSILVSAFGVGLLPGFCSHHPPTSWVPWCPCDHSLGPLDTWELELGELLCGSKNHEGLGTNPQSWPHCNTTRG